MVLFFVVVYVHMVRGFYYSSWKPPNELVWVLGLATLVTAGVVLANGGVDVALHDTYYSCGGAVLLAVLLATLQYCCYGGVCIGIWC